MHRLIYGESQPTPEANNLRGQVAQLFDCGGVITHERYDFKGNLLRETRRLAAQYRQTLDHSATVALEPAEYSRSSAYDALNRPLRLTTPDGSVLRPSYNEANLLERVEGNLRGSSTLTVFVSDIDYDEKGQRMLIAYGNGVKTTYRYDSQTFRLTRLATTRGSDSLQDLQYTYDPVGNITHLQDDAQQTLYFRNRRVEPSADYTYDALYQLIDASGREHLGQLVGGGLTNVPTSPDDSPRVGLLHPEDGNAMGRYFQKLIYDEVGNLQKMTHRGSDPSLPGWTRDYAYEEPSQLESGKTSNRLSKTTVGTDTVRYVHDAHGNMTGMPHLSRMQWDYNDAQGQRLRKVTDHPDDNKNISAVYFWSSPERYTAHELLGHMWLAMKGMPFEHTGRLPGKGLMVDGQLYERAYDFIRAIAREPMGLPGR